MAVVMQEVLDALLREAIARIGGPRDPFGPGWNMKAQIVSGSETSASASAWITRLAHPTEGINAFQRYDQCGLELREGRWEPVEWLTAAIDEMVMTAHRLEMRDDAVRLGCVGRGDHDQAGQVLRGRTHANAPPAWAYSIDRIVRLAALGAGWTPREISTPAGSAFDEDGTPSRDSLKGLRLMELSRQGAATATYGGRIHGSLIKAEFGMVDAGSRSVQMGEHDGGRLVSIDGIGDLPETMMQAIVGRDIGELLGIPGLDGPVGVPVTGATREGRILHLTHATVLDALEGAPDGVDTGWLQVG